VPAVVVQHAMPHAMPPGTCVAVVMQSMYRSATPGAFGPVEISRSGLSVV
jgi:hypothetical protein